MSSITDLMNENKRLRKENERLRDSIPVNNKKLNQLVKVDQLVRENGRLKKVEQAAQRFIEQLKDNGGVKMSEITRLAKSLKG